MAAALHWRRAGAVRQMFVNEAPDNFITKVTQVNPMAARPVREVRHAVDVHAHCVGRVVSVDQTADVGRYERCEIAVAKPRRRHRMKGLEGIHEYLL
jgi:hypothetical protein